MTRVFPQRTLTQTVIFVAGQIARVKQEVLVNHRFYPLQRYKSNCWKSKRPTEVERSPAARRTTEQSETTCACCRDRHFKGSCDSWSGPSSSWMYAGDGGRRIHRWSGDRNNRIDKQTERARLVSVAALLDPRKKTRGDDDSIEPIFPGENRRWWLHA